MAEGERGPKGDHGQHGDEGAEGRVGEQGEVGRTGETGQVGRTGEPGHPGLAGQPGATGAEGREGRRGRSNWQAYTMMGAAMLAALLVFLWLDDKQHKAQAETALSNCQQIEVVKTQIRETVEKSLQTLPTLSYYKRNPDELAQAIRNAKASVARFRERDCYDLPAVAAELEKPQPRP